MAFANRSKTTDEILGLAFFFGDRPQVGKQAGGFIVARRIASFDLGVDLTPDAFAPSRGILP